MNLRDAAASGEPFRRAAWHADFYATKIFDGAERNCRMCGSTYRLTFEIVAPNGRTRNGYVTREDALADDYEPFVIGGAK